MHLYHFLRRDLILSNRYIVVVAILAGLSNALILYLVNIGAQASEETSQTLLLLCVIVSIATFVVSQRYLLVTIGSDVEHALHRVRLRLIGKIQNAELRSFEAVGRAQLNSGMSTDLMAISSAAPMLTLTFQSLILLFFGLIYVAMQSLVALVFYVAFVIIAALLLLRQIASLAETEYAAMGKSNEMMEAVSHVLDGFREVKMSEMRRSDLYAHLEETSTTVVGLKQRSQVVGSTINVSFNSSLYVLVAAVVFILPAIASIDQEALINLTAALLFLISPLIILMSTVPGFNIANVAASRIAELEMAIDHHIRPMAQRQAESLVINEAQFRDLVFDNVEFDYVSANQEVLFHLGPVNLSISPGETIFISGGNGSGKSTLVHLLTGLYFPTQGEMRLDGQRLSEDNAGPYRELFSVIFYDFHLFDRLYGLRDIDLVRVGQLLEQFQLSDKTQFVGDRFTTLDLSTGQKRRLALVMSELEDRPIYVFDEWAAEQDPGFRRYFYRDFLPDLKSRGKTVIAVTHDDRYYDLPYIDRILRFEEGQLRLDEEGL